jgi:hypothetical protein
MLLLFRQVRFARSDGFATRVLVEGSPLGAFTSDYLTHGATTDHRVKFSYHRSGIAHFSQTKRAMPIVRKESTPLFDYSGPLFSVHLQGPCDFEEINLHRTRRQRTLTAARFDKEVEALLFSVSWYRGSELAQRSVGAVGPTVRFEAGGRWRTAAVLSPRRGPRDHVMLFTCKAEEPRPPIDQSFLLFVGALDVTDPPPERSDALVLAYPRGALEFASDLLPTMDLRRSGEEHD